MRKRLKFVFAFFPQHLVEGLLNFRRRVCRSFWLDLAFQDPPGETDQYYSNFFYPPRKDLPLNSPQRKDLWLNLESNSADPILGTQTFPNERICRLAHPNERICGLT